MNVMDAAHRIAHECDGGCDALAARMGIGKVVFSGKVRPNNTTHILGLVEAVRMQQLTGRRDILHAMADDLDCVCLPKPSVEDMGDDMAVMIAKTCAEFGDYMREVDVALHNHRVSPNELKRLQKELIELICAATRIHTRMATMTQGANRS